MNQEHITNIALDLLWEKVQSVELLLTQERCEHQETKELLESEVTRRRYERQDMDRLRANLTSAIERRNEWQDRCSRNRKGYVSKLSEVESVIISGDPSTEVRLQTILDIVRKAIGDEEVPF